MGRFSDAYNEVAERARNTQVASATRAKEWLIWTKDEIESFTDKWDWLYGESTLATIADQATYELTEIADDVDSIVNMRLESPRMVLDPITIEYADYLDPAPISGTPEAFAMTGSSVYLIPPPSEVLTYDVRYRIVSPTLSGDDDAPLWAKKWDHVWITGALRFAYQYHDDVRFFQLEQLFNRGLRKMMAGKDRSDTLIRMAPFRPYLRRWSVRNRTLDRFE